ncbi:MAG TPA: hypothetical protein DHW46_10845, partial [Halomonas sp.]|nr:hypothetical protein [Halomonas sp.]
MGRPHHAEPTSPAGTAVAQQAAVLASYARRLKRRGWRGLVWLNGAPEQARQQALALWQALDWSAPLWIGDDQQAPVAPSLPSRKARTRLGAEHQL